MPKAQLFITCLGDQFYTSTLQNMTHLLERLGVELTFPPEQTCCGQPLFNNGFEDKTRPVALNFMHAFAKSDAPIIGPSGSCVSMIKHHYPSLFKAGTPEYALAVDIASRIFEFTEYLVNVLKVTDVGAVYPHKVTYHASCHYLREMGLKTEAKTLLNSVKGLEFVSLKEEETCCGFGGAFTVTYPEVSRSMMENKVKHIISSGADTVVTCEPGCLMNVAGGLHKADSSIRAMHIIDLLSSKIVGAGSPRSYWIDGKFMTETHPYIGFEKYSEHVPPSIPLAVQQATSRFVGGRAARVAELPQWEQLRQIGSDIRQHTIENMDIYLTRLEQKVLAAGGHVHWAETAEEARRIVLQIAKENNVKNVVKSKSMATEEIELNHALEAAGIESLETDLGEYIIQLAGTGPSHIIVPAVHLKKEEIAALFSAKLNINASTDPIELARIAREVLREKFLNAGMGISGGNFLIAETGTLVMVTNEGNGRMCTTMPDLHLAVVGIDKVIPDWESLTVFLKLLARSATGQKLSTYTQFITGPRRVEGEFGPKEFHLVLLDNGRSRILKDPIGRDVLKCIRCGACANVCPVYKNVGGFAYGSFISGPIGAILSPQMLGTQAARELPFASTLCGACADVCPVKIPIPSILSHLRRRVAQGDAFALPTISAPIRVTANLASLALAQNWIYRLGASLLPIINPFFRKNNWLSGMPYPLNRWTKVRPLPPFDARFRKWWNVRSAKETESAR